MDDATYIQDGVFLCQIIQGYTRKNLALSLFPESTKWSQVDNVDYPVMLCVLC